MKAIRVHQYGPAEAMKLEETPDFHPKPGEVLVRLRAAGVNPVDAYIRSGNYALLPDSLPYTPGSDGAGEVAAIGADVTAFKPGGRVYVRGLGVNLPGTYGQYTCAPTAFVHPLASRLSFEQGACVGVAYPTAWCAVEYANASPGETMLVHGASGSVGTATIQIARAKGLTVIGSAGSEKGRQAAIESGAHHVVEHGAVEKVMALTGGQGVDVVVEMLANVNLGKDLQMLARGGRVVVVGNRGTVEIDPRDAMRREATIRGMLLWNVPEVELARVHAKLYERFDNGELTPVVGRTLPLAEAPQAHEAVMSPGACGKIVLVID